MKLATLFTLFAATSAKKETVIEIYNSDGQVAIVADENAAREGRPVFGEADAERGPKECAGKKLPGIKNGYFVCHRNLNNSGNKKGKKKKCRFHCDKGWIVSTKKAKARMASSSVTPIRAGSPSPRNLCAYAKTELS